MTSIRRCLDDAIERLEEHSDSARLDAELLLCHCLSCDRSHLIAWPDKVLGDEDRSCFEELISRRLSGTPIAYIKGEREFWSRSFLLNDHTLIPRPETEHLIEFVLGTFDNTPLRVADLGTGSGAIAVTLACERPAWDILATDIDSHALEIARRNADRHAVENVSFGRGSWFEPVSDEMDIIVSNPPYIADDDVHLQQGDVRFEPRTALTSGEDGLDAIRLLCEGAAQRLTTDGWLIIEHGYDQKDAVRALFESSGFRSIRQLDDAGQRPRLTAGQRAD